MTPCRTCAMLIISCWIKNVIAEKKYHAWAESEAMFKEAGVELRYFDESVEQYAKQ
jgi:dCMP deaminase